MLIKLFALLAGIFGFSAVALGAFAAHGLRGRLSSDMLAVFQTGVQYQMYHALALLLTCVLALQWPPGAMLRYAAGSFVAGIILFSGSLYLMALFGMRWLGPVTPVGGVAFLAGWACLTVAVWRQVSA